MPALHWLDERLAAQGTTADDIVQEEQQRQGAMNVTIRNVITSMRLMSAIDWRELFESVSLVDAMLRAESNFAALDFATRDLYRRAIEELARGSSHAEIEVARLALLAAKRAGDEAANEDDDDLGAPSRIPDYYLIAKGRPAFERKLGFRVSDEGMARSRQRGRWDFRLSRDRRDRHRHHRRMLMLSWDVDAGTGTGPSACLRSSR